MKRELRREDAFPIPIHDPLVRRGFPMKRELRQRATSELFGTLTRPKRLPDEEGITTRTRNARRLQVHTRPKRLPDEEGIMTSRGRGWCLPTRTGSEEASR